jgi:hypothetical protein
MKFCNNQNGAMRSTPKPTLVTNGDSHCDYGSQSLRPMLRIVSQPLSPEPAGRARFGFFASAFRARKTLRIARTGNNH